MPITMNALFESNVLNSIKEYLNLNVVTPYNTYVSGGSFSSPLGIMLEKPADPEITPVLPLLVLFRPVSNRAYQATGNGDGTGWIYNSYRIGCFPAVNADKKPDPVPEFYLRSLMRYAVETALYMPIYNYSGGRTLIESAQVADARIVMPIGKQENIMDEERFRFDAVFTLNLPVVAING